MADTQDMIDEIIRAGRQYLADDPRRRVPMLAQAAQQPAGDAIAAPKAPEAGPELDEFAYLGMPSPPAPGTPGMPAFSRQPIPMPGMLSAQTAPSMPEGYSYGDDGIVRDPEGRPAEFRSPSRREIAKDVGTAAFPMAYKGARLGMDALGLAQKGGTALARGGKDLARDILGAPGQQGAMDPNVPELAGSHGGMSAARAAQLIQLMQDYMRGEEASSRPAAMGVRG